MLLIYDVCNILFYNDCIYSAHVYANDVGLMLWIVGCHICGALDHKRKECPNKGSHTEIKRWSRTQDLLSIIW